MAESNTSAAINHLVERDGAIAMSIARKEAARQAASEIEELCIALRDSIRTSGCPDLLVRGMTKRMQELACVVMSAVEDSGVDVASLYQDIGSEIPQ